MHSPKEASDNLAEEIALFRYGLIADLVRLEPGSKNIYRMLRERAEHSYTIPGSARQRVAAETLRSWLKAYRRHGFAGLYPKPRSDRGKSRSIAAHVVDLLLQRKEHNPGLTVRQLIAEVQERSSEPCELAESTVHRLLQQAGLSGAAGKDSNDASSKDRRQFGYRYAGELWMSDVMHGPAVLREGRRKHKTYLIAFLDDATRVITHAEFCWSENTATFFPVFKKALLRRGLPLRLYVDNGANYRSRQLELVCAKLGVTLVHARPYQPQGKGKIERFFRTVRMQFLNNTTATSLDALNRELWAWIEGEYHHAPHRGLGGEAPIEQWMQVAERVQLVGPELDLDDLFLWEDKRKVRTDRTVSLGGHQYEVDALLVGHKVTLRYDPAAPPTRPLQVWHKAERQADATALDRHANCYVKRNNTPSAKKGVDFTSLENSYANIDRKE
jgi:transposase InsO family protein